MIRECYNVTQQPVTLYGIPNCDTIKKARRYLDEQQIDYQFHDYRKDGLTLEMLTQFEQELGWQALLNKRGTTYRQLSDAQKQSLDRDQALALMLEYPAMIKRPLLVVQGRYLLGFSPASYQQFFA
ncbi:ArsC family reductase [Celerinatantimonas sp. YJH-8]|uniref:ArsC family reductase n=1 Tax=Celerinatantimonas sp. YJH-8 TaxID=3228714 RepID=UPI0038CBA73A